MPSTDLSITVPGGVELSTTVWAGGDRRPFLLVHGLASNRRTWQATGNRLHALGHPVAAVDLRGHGRSSQPDSGYDFETLGDDLLALIDALGLDRPVVAGQSTGGNLALDLAQRASGAVSGAVGVDGGVIELQEQWPVWEDCAAALRPPPLAGRAVAEIGEQLRRGHPDWSEEGVAATLANFEVLPDGTVRPWLTIDRHLALLRALWEHRPSQLFADLRAPLLLVLADSGDDWSERKRQAAARATAQGGACVRVHWFCPGDHDLHVQHPDDVAELLSAATTDGFFPA